MLLAGLPQSPPSRVQPEDSGGQEPVLGGPRGLGEWAVPGSMPAPGPTEEMWAPGARAQASGLALQVRLPARAEGKKACDRSWDSCYRISFLFLLHRKMVPRANRWMICLTFLFRVEVKPRPPSYPSSLLSP